jgi:hypothetical protein
MSQFSTLIWLKWTLFKNSLRSTRAAVNRIASLFAMLLTSIFALILALGLGVSAYALTHPEGVRAFIERRSPTPIDANISAEFILFSIFALCYLLWATIPLSTGSSRQFEPGNLLMYPISLKKLFALDFVSDLVTTQAIFAIPSVIAIGIGAGLGSGHLVRAMVASLAAAAVGLSLTKWLAVSIGSLTRRKRTRGETLIALIGAVLGLSGALVGQIAPVIFKYADVVKGLRWTPPGAAAFALSTGLTGSISAYLLAVLVLLAYTLVLVQASYWIARRTVLGIGGRKRKAAANVLEKTETYTGWKLPLVSSELAAVVEKELRYVMRNAQVRMMALMPLILILVRIVNRRSFAQGRDAPQLSSDFFNYGEGLMATVGVLYVFLVLTGISCNLFSFEEGGMRALILSPVERWKILVGKNISTTVVAFFFAAALLAINELIFRDMTLKTLLFVSLSFVIFAAMISIIGNWLSIRFPKRMQFGKRMNVSGVVGLLLIPMIVVLALPPLGAVAAAYIAQSLAVGYVTLFVFALIAVGFYVLVIDSQGELLQRREVEILDAVCEPRD